MDCPRREPDRLRGVAVVDPATPLDEVPGLHEAGIAGIRLNLIGQPVPDLGGLGWASLLAAVAGLGWHSASLP